MGNRKRVGTHSGRRDQKIKMQQAMKEFTRGKAMKALSDGADFNDAKFTNHRNYHVRERAWVLAGAMVPENMEERKALCHQLSKGRTLAGEELVKIRLGLNDDAVVANEAAAA